MHSNLLYAVFACSLVSMAYEIILVRVLSVTQWNHLSFMVISIALLGFAAGGSCLCFISFLKKTGIESLAKPKNMNLILFSLSIAILFAYIALRYIPLDCYRIISEPAQLLYLFIIYLLSSTPFFITGLMISIAFSVRPEQTGLIYFSTMTGSSLGVLVPYLGLQFVGEGRLMLVISLVPALMFFWFYLSGIHLRDKGCKPGLKSGYLIFSSFLILMVFFMVGNPFGITDVTPSQYKHFSSLMQLPDTKLTESTWSIRGNTDIISSRYIRYAPGLSLKFHGALPRQEVILTDGDQGTYVYHIGSSHDMDFSRYTLSYIAYLLNENHPEDILLLLNGGGVSPVAALSSGAKNIRLIEQNKQRADYFKKLYPIDVLNNNPRVILKTMTETYDIISLETPGYSLPGVSGLNLEYLLTRESLGILLSRLKDNGVLVISRNLLLPPSDSLRMWNLVYHTLKDTGNVSPEKKMVMIRNWDSYCLIVSNAIPNKLSVIHEFVSRMNFDIVYIHGTNTEGINRYNVFEKPYYADLIAGLTTALQSGSEDSFTRDYLMKLDIPDDDHPYFGSFLKWGSFFKLYKSLGSRSYFLMLSGESVVVFILIVSLFISGILVLSSWVAIRGKGVKLPGRSLIFFISIGAGFVLVEICLIKLWALLFGNAVVSLTVVISGLLLFSGAGGYLLRNLSPKPVQILLVLLTLILVGYMFWIPYIQSWQLTLPLWGQYVTAYVFMIPPGLLMGVPFSYGMRNLADSPVGKAFIWSVNGASSVIASIVSEQIALSYGILSILFISIWFYLISAMTCQKNGLGRND